MATSVHNQRYSKEDIQAACDKAGVNTDTMRKRLSRGMTLLQAAALPKRTPRECGLMTPNRSRLPYSQEEIEKAAKECGMKLQSFKSRLYRGMTLEEARGTRKMNKSQSGKRGSRASPWRNEKICRGSITDWDKYYAENPRVILGDEK